MALQTSFTDIGGRITGRLVVGKDIGNSDDSKYYPLKLTLSAMGVTSDTPAGQRRKDLTFYVGTEQDTPFDTWKQVYDACPSWSKGGLKQLYQELIDVDLDQ